MEEILNAAWIGLLWGTGIGVASLVSSAVMIVVMMIFKAIDEWDR